MMLKIYWQFKNEKQTNNFLGTPEVWGFKPLIIATDFHHLTNLIFSILKLTLFYIFKTFLMKCHFALHFYNKLTHF